MSHPLYPVLAGLEQRVAYAVAQAAEYGEVAITQWVEEAERAAGTEQVAEADGDGEEGSAAGDYRDAASADGGDGGEASADEDDGEGGGGTTDGEEGVEGSEAPSRNGEPTVHPSSQAGMSPKPSDEEDADDSAGLDQPVATRASPGAGNTDNS